MISCISLKMYVLCESSISPIFTVYSRDDDSQLMLSNFIFTNGQCGLWRIISMKVVCTNTYLKAWKDNRKPCVQRGFISIFMESLFAEILFTDILFFPFLETVLSIFCNNLYLL